MPEYKQFVLGDICTRLSSGKAIPASQVHSEGSYPVYGGNGLRGYTAQSNFVGDCAIIGRQGAFCGNVRYFSGEAYMTEHAVVVCANAENNTRYLAYLLSMMNLGRLSGQSAQPGLSVKTLSKQQVELPSLDVQNKVVSILTSLDSKIALNEQINENLEQQIEASLLESISSINKANTVKLGEYLYIKGRIGWKGLKKSEYLPASNYRIINGESLTAAGIDWDKAGFISEERYNESPEIMLCEGDILLSKDGTIGKIGYVNKLVSPTTVASGIFVIRNIKPTLISTQFIYYLLKSSLFTTFIASRTEGSVIPHLYQKDFMEFEFPLPDMEIMHRFDQTTAPMFKMVMSNLQENEALVATREMLLPKLMSGEIDVSNHDL